MTGNRYRHIRTRKKYRGKRPSKQEKVFYENCRIDPVLKNSFKKIGYGGPCPPPGPAHRYVFKLYALDSEVGISPGISKEGLLRAVEGQVIQQAQLTGLFKR